MRSVTVTSSRAAMASGQQAVSFPSLALCTYASSCCCCCCCCCSSPGKSSPSHPRVARARMLRERRCMCRRGDPCQGVPVRPVQGAGEALGDGPSARGGPPRAGIRVQPPDPDEFSSWRQMSRRSSRLTRQCELWRGRRLDSGSSARGSMPQRLCRCASHVSSCCKCADRPVMLMPSMPAY